MRQDTRHLSLIIAALAFVHSVNLVLFSLVFTHTSVIVPRISSSAIWLVGGVALLVYIRGSSGHTSG